MFTGIPEVNRVNPTYDNIKQRQLILHDEVWSYLNKVFFGIYVV